MLVVKSIMDILFVVYYLGGGGADHFDNSRLYIEHEVNASSNRCVCSFHSGWVGVT